jgi:hypothetical protein
MAEVAEPWSHVRSPRHSIHYAIILFHFDFLKIRNFISSSTASKGVSENNYIQTPKTHQHASSTLSSHPHFLPPPFHTLFSSSATNSLLRTPRRIIIPLRRHNLIIIRPQLHIMARPRREMILRRYSAARSLGLANGNVLVEGCGTCYGGLVGPGC